MDTIGSYTFAKTLEYKAKQGLAGTGKEVTVIPPNEYEERFVSSMDSYFVACPGALSCLLRPGPFIYRSSDLSSSLFTALFR